MSNTLYRGLRVGGRCIVTKGGVEIDPRKSLRLRNHSPAGFEWGYAGSGSAQLALALLLEELGPETALDLYQDFKRAVVLRFEGDEWELTGTAIRVWSQELMCGILRAAELAQFNEGEP